MTAVVNNSDHVAAASKLLWGRDTSTLGGTARAGGGVGVGVGGGGGGGGVVANKGETTRLGTQTWAPSSRMTRSQGADQHQQGVVAVDKALVQVAGKELGNKHTWPRRRDVSSLGEFFLPLFWGNF